MRTISGLSTLSRNNTDNMRITNIDVQYLLVREQLETSQLLIECCGKSAFSRRMRIESDSLKDFPNNFCRIRLLTTPCPYTHTLDASSPLLLVDSSDSRTENIEYLPIVYTDNQIYAHSNATWLKDQQIVENST